jgi:glutaminyl-peptide cyclotransferase
MIKSRAILSLVAAAVLAGVALWLWNSRTDTDVIVKMEEFALSSTTTTTAAPPADDFPAIEDSGVRDPDARTSPVAGSVEILRSAPHDTSAFTQGFELFNGRLFESTGLTGSSTIREVDATTGEVLRSAPVEGVFAEGMTIVDDEIIQITWTDQIAFRYRIEDFERLGTYAYDGQGWGLCDDGSRLVMSDGSATLTFRSRTTFAEQSTVDVTFNGAPVQQLNELECVGDTIFANIWKSGLIIEIDPSSGRVITVFNANSLRPEETRANEQSVLNGIAYDADADTFLLTGKNWPLMYEVRLHSAP